MHYLIRFRAGGLLKTETTTMRKTYAQHVVVAVMLWILVPVGYAGEYFNANEQGVAIDGFDPVAYFELRMAVRGSETHQTSWQGVTWYFSNEEHKRVFLTDPERFAPKFGGWCAMAMTGGQVVEVDFGNAWTADVSGLYFNVNKDVRLKWLRGYNRNVRKGNENWPETRLSIEEGHATIHRRAQMPSYYNE